MAGSYGSCGSYRSYDRCSAVDEERACSLAAQPRLQHERGLEQSATSRAHGSAVSHCQQQAC